jgi:hypothetical protein
MQPFYTVYSPAEIALNLIFDAIWCIGWLIGFGIATVQYFAAPVPPKNERVIIRGQEYVIASLRSPLLSSTLSIA